MLQGQTCHDKVKYDHVKVKHVIITRLKYSAHVPRMRPLNMVDIAEEAQPLLAMATSNATDLAVSFRTTEERTRDVRRRQMDLFNGARNAIEDAHLRLNEVRRILNDRCR